MWLLVTIINTIIIITTININTLLVEANNIHSVKNVHEQPQPHKTTIIRNKRGIGDFIRRLVGGGSGSDGGVGVRYKNPASSSANIVASASASVPFLHAPSPSLLQASQPYFASATGYVSILLL